MACKNPETHFPAITSLALPKGSMSNKVVLVTGGGTGLGKAIASTFASLGAKVAIAGRRKDVLETTANEIRSATGGIIEQYQMDVKDPASIAHAIDSIEEKFGALPNVLINNAAGNFIMATERLSPNAIRAIVDIVLHGTINVTLEIARRAIKRNQGCTVLSITTPYARHGSPFVVPSAVAKAGVENMTRSLSTEWGKHGWRFNVIAPGPIPTEGAFGRLSTLNAEEAKEHSKQSVPLGRVGTPEELANLASFVCSDYGNWINGAIIDFDGGQQWFNHGSSMSARQLHDLDDIQWQQIEDTIRNRTGKTKSKM